MTAKSHANVDAATVAALAHEPLDWRYKGLPVAWSGMTPAALLGADPFDAGAVGPLCTLDAAALDHNVRAMASWCAAHGVELAPHGKTHMSPQLFARQAAAGACAVTVATTSQARVYRAFGASPVIIANEVVDEPGLRWLASELDADPAFDVICWVDSVRGVELMTAALAGARRPLDVCVEVGMAGGRTGCRTDADVDGVVAAVSASDRLRLVGVAGYEAATAGDVRGYLGWLRATTLRLAGRFESASVIVSAGGSSYFDVVAEALTAWPADLSVRTVLRSGCYLTHDDGLYARTSPLRGELRPALTVWGRVVSRPEPDLALVTMGRRDVSFDADLPTPRGLAASVCERLNDQHAYLRLGATDRSSAEVGAWIGFGVSHPCTVFDKWQLIPLLDGDRRVVDLVRTFF